MKMITGGAFQGKSEWAVRSLGLSEGDILNGADCEPGAVMGAVCVKNYQELVRRLEDAGRDPLEFTGQLCRSNSSLIVIMDEVGCGIVPIGKQERSWREDCGRCGTMIAANSEEVYRMCCGIAVRIK